MFRSLAHEVPCSPCLPSSLEVAACSAPQRARTSPEPPSFLERRAKVDALPARGWPPLQGSHWGSSRPAARGMLSGWRDLSWGSGHLFSRIFEVLGLGSSADPHTAPKNAAVSFRSSWRQVRCTTVRQRAQHAATRAHSGSSPGLRKPPGSCRLPHHSSTAPKWTPGPTLPARCL